MSLLVYSQVVLGLMIPLLMVLLFYYAGEKVIGEFATHWVTTIITLVFAGTIIALNVYPLPISAEFPRGPS